MNDFKEDVKVVGYITRTIEYNDGRPPETIEFKNTILKNGKIALARALANFGETTESSYITRMIFGTDGAINGVPRHVDEARNGLFGLTLLSKPVLASVDSNFENQVSFVAIISFNEANGSALSEMALQMNNGQLYSMRTFPDLTKTEQMQITWSWKISFI